MSKPALTICSHCQRETSDASGLCLHCDAPLDVGEVLVAQQCHSSVVNGGTVGVEDTPMILLTFNGTLTNSDKTPQQFRVAVRPDDVSPLRSSLLDRLMTVGVRIENGVTHYDRPISES